MKRLKTNDLQGFYDISLNFILKKGRWEKIPGENEAGKSGDDTVDAEHEIVDEDKTNSRIVE